MPPTGTDSDLVTSKITVALIAKATEDLETLKERTKLSKTDIVNRAISLYEFVQGELDEGGELVLRRPDGVSHLVKLL